MLAKEMDRRPGRIIRLAVDNTVNQAKDSGPRYVGPKKSN
jgi:hypothetical protein